MQPTQLNKSQQWLRDNPIPPAMGIVDELKSMLDPGNMTGANAIQAAIEGKGMSTTERITTGLTGVVQGIGFAAGSKGGEVGVKNVTSAIETGKIVNPKALLENIKARERVIIHASPQPGLTELLPNFGSRAMPTENVLFGWNPRKANSGIDAISNSLQYSKPKNGFVKRKIPLPSQEAQEIYRKQLIDELYPPPPGSIYVAKVPTNATAARVPKKITNSNKMVVSTEPGRVVAEVPLTVGRKQAFETVQQEMRRAGALPRKIPDVVDDVFWKIDDGIEAVKATAKKIQKNLRK